MPWSRRRVIGQYLGDKTDERGHSIRDADWISQYHNHRHPMHQMDH